jgi:cysteine desulfurase
MDYNATTPLRDEVKTAMIADFDVYGNASSMHGAGRAARAKLEKARAAVAALIGAPAETIIFTSGGSESNNTVFQTMRNIVENAASAAEGKSISSTRTEIIISAVEHPCVLNSAKFLASRGFIVHVIGVDANGKLNMEEFRAKLSDKTLLVSIMLANNEIGTIEDIAAIAKLAKASGAFVHTDAVQGAGKIPVNVDELGVDYLTMSAHKIYGPKGIGALYVRKGAPIFPLIQGGHQEDGARAGTYNNIGIFGFGKAAELALQDLPIYGEKMMKLRTMLRDGLLEKIPNIKINGHPTDVLPNTLNVSFPGAEGEAILLTLDLLGIEVSTGSACASGSLDPSHVLLALGATPELAHGSIRFSLGWGVTEADIQYIIDTVPPQIARLRAMSTVSS